MEQIVYVVLDSKEKKVLGAYNDYARAEAVALGMARQCYDGTEISITPVCVDRDNIVNGTRQYLLNKQEVFDATIEEMELARPDGIPSAPVIVGDNDEDDEDEEEYEDDEDEDDEDEDEDEEEDSAPALPIGGLLLALVLASLLGGEGE